MTLVSTQEPSSPFVGRGQDAATLRERLLKQRNVVLVRALAGTGKSRLMAHLGVSWQQSGLVDQVFSFSYGERAWTARELVGVLRPRLFGEGRGEFPPSQLLESSQAAVLPKVVQSLGRLLNAARLTSMRREVVRALRARRHLLILDSLERMEAQERNALHTFLQELVGGSTLVLLGSRGEERWLAPHTFEDNVYELPGLDEEAASALVDDLLERHGVQGDRGEAHLEKLLPLLEGHPLALQVVLGSLTRKTPAELLGVLEQASAPAEPPQGARRRAAFLNPSLLGCLTTPYDGSSPQARLLLCLAPFTGPMDAELLQGPYLEQLQQQPALEHLPLQRWGEVLKEAVERGLLLQSDSPRRCLSTQPVLRYFLRLRLEEEPPLAQAVEHAFLLHSKGLVQSLRSWAESRDWQERQKAEWIVEVEYANMREALRRVLARHENFEEIFRFLHGRLAKVAEHLEALALCDQVLTATAAYPPERRDCELEMNVLRVLRAKGIWHRMTGQYEAARATHEQLLARGETTPGLPEVFRARLRTVTHLELGITAVVEHNWPLAEQRLDEALKLSRALLRFPESEEVKDRGSQIRILAWQCCLARHRRQWARAREQGLEGLGVAVQLKEEESLKVALSALAQLWLVQLWLEGEAGDLVAQVATALGTSLEEAEDSLQRAMW